MSGGRFGADFLSTYEEGIKKEWVIGNGLGGYASSTIIGAGTRTYHGLLVATPENSPGRLLLLSSLDEEISVNEEVYKLAVHKYPDTISPTGFQHLSKFIRYPFPLWVYRPGDFIIKKKVFMIHNSNTTCVLYDITSRREGAVLKIFPLVSSRDFNLTARRIPVFLPESRAFRSETGKFYRFYFLHFINLQYHPEPVWYFNLSTILKCRGGLFSGGQFQSGMV